jgi:dephospho-CoA kinase
MGAVLAESLQQGVVSLDILAPRLTPAAVNPMLPDIQAAWKRISDQGQVRVLTLETRDCLEGGLELVKDGIEVRVARRDLDSDSLSYHLFGTPRSAITAIVNHHRDSIDRPVRLNGIGPTQVFSKHFEAVWAVAPSLEAVIAEKIIEKAHECKAPTAIRQALRDTGLNLAPCLERVLWHLAFRSSCSVVFVVGLPGAGKSMARRILAERLEARGIQSRELTDYLYAFRDFLHGQIQLVPPRADGFEAYPGGAFVVRDEAALRPALQALDGAVRDSLKESEVTIAEFARSADVAALDQFDDIRSLCWVLYLQAPAELRSARLSKRIEPPELSVKGRSVIVTPSDNHRLPSTAERSLYPSDDIEQLERSPRWRDRMLRIDNDLDDGGAKVKSAIDDFMSRVADPYLRSVLS